MTKIRTAEEVLISYAFDDDPSNAALKERTILCMQEYAKQFIDLAAEECEPITDLTTDQIAEIPVNDKESILKLKEMVK